MFIQNLYVFFLFSLLAAFPAALCADSWTSSRPDGHAPIGVMGDHRHHAGEWMASYRYMFMGMDGNRDGTDRLSEAEVLQAYMVTPVEMDMTMQMAGIMYAPSDSFTLMAMIPYLEYSMNHLTRSGGQFKTRSSGLGDMRLSGLFPVATWEKCLLHANLGISLPTGSIDEKDDTPAGSGQVLPYPMQLGSGTWDLLPGITFLGQNAQWSWGAQGTAILRLGENDEDYSLGDALKVLSWLGHRFTDTYSGTLRLQWHSWGDIDGADTRLNPRMVPTADPSLRGGKRLDLLAGINIYLREGAMQGHRLALEYGVPVYQDLDGPQLETEWILTLGWQLAW